MWFGLGGWFVVVLVMGEAVVDVLLWLCMSLVVVIVGFEVVELWMV